MKTKKKRSWWRITIMALAVMLVSGSALLFVLWRRVPPSMKEDFRAGIAARNIADPDARLQKYLELRYGTLSDPANRQKAFADFFNTEHIKALQVMVKHTPESQRAASIQATARWVENYRQSLTAADRAALKSQFATEQGRAMLRQATAQYNSQDAQYRGQTSVVISQLLKTINSL